MVGQHKWIILYLVVFVLLPCLYTIYSANDYIAAMREACQNESKRAEYPLMCHPISIDSLSNKIPILCMEVVFVSLIFSMLFVIGPIQFVNTHLWPEKVKED